MTQTNQNTTKTAAAKRPASDETAAPVVEKKAKHAKAEAPPAAAGAGDSEVAPVAEEPTVADLIDKLLQGRQEQQLFQKSELDILRNIKKVYKKEIRLLAKTKSKKTRKGTKREPSGIATDKYISPQLCRFLDEPEGTRLPRTMVTKRIHAYVKANKLLGREGILRKDGKLSEQYITPNDSLKALIGDPDMLNFFTLQTALNPHFVEPVAEQPVAAA